LLATDEQVAEHMSVKIAKPAKLLWDMPAWMGLEVDLLLKIRKKMVLIINSEFNGNAKGTAQCLMNSRLLLPVAMSWISPSA
jgi:hypothetical protein